MFRMLPLSVPHAVRALVAVAVVGVCVPSLSAQQAAPPKPAESHAHHGAAPAQEKEAEHAKSGWKELDAYHDVMSAAWHPAKNDSLGPARSSAAALVTAAKTWAKAAAPMGCQAPAVKTAVARLVPESEAVAALVARNADDATLKAALKTVHDTFHVVEEGCKPHQHH
jgi:hypothetical protein